MKKIFVSFAALVLAAFIISSCEQEKYFDSSLLAGKWKSGTLFERYFDDGTGYSWDEGDDVREEEAQDFTWTLAGAELIKKEQMEIGDVEITKIFTVTELSSTTLKYNDDFGRGYTFTRVDE